MRNRDTEYFTIVMTELDGRKFYCPYPSSIEATGYTVKRDAMKVFKKACIQAKHSKCKGAVMLIKCYLLPHEWITDLTRYLENAKHSDGSKIHLNCPMHDVITKEVF